MLHFDWDLLQYSDDKSEKKNPSLYSGKYSFRLPFRRFMWYLSLKYLSPPTELQSATNHTTTIQIFTTVKTSNLINDSYLYPKTNFEDWCTNRCA